MNDLLVVWEHRDQLFTGVLTTLGLVATAGAASLLLGMLLTPALMSQRSGVARLAAAYVDAMRSTPLLLFVYVIYFGLPNIGLRIDSWWAGAIALIIYNTAYFAELLRGAWSDLPPSLVEAGRAYGFSGLGLLRRIVLPPVLISAMPLVGNQLVQIVKDSAFLTIIAVAELTHEANSIQSTYFIPLASFVVAVLFYWAICLAIEGAIGRLSQAAEGTKSMNSPIDPSMLSPLTSASASASAFASTQKPAAPADVVLQMSGISKSFGSNAVLRDVSLQVAKGEIVCLLGPSGSGKSTLLRCANWLEVPDAGHVILSGRRVGVREGGSVAMSDRELAKIRSRVGMVFQHFALWPHLSVLQNVMEAPLHVLKRPKEEVRLEAEALLDRVGLADKRDAWPSSLSGGQKQRVGIARALAIKPDILLLDEPTSALDPMLVGEVLGVMRSLAEQGATMIIVTHEMAFARQVASRVVFMDEGQIVESGAPAQFFNAPTTPRARQFLSRFHGQQSGSLTG